MWRPGAKFQLNFSYIYPKIGSRIYSYRAPYQAMSAYRPLRARVNAACGRGGCSGGGEGGDQHDAGPKDIHQQKSGRGPSAQIKL